MKKLIRHIVFVTIIASTFAIIGVSSASALPATVERDSGCLVGYSDLPYLFDDTCRAQSVFKLDADGSFQFYIYQDHGRLPADYLLPSEAVLESFELCLNFGGTIGVRCGIADQVVTPSGEYKSSLTIR